MSASGRHMALPVQSGTSVVPRAGRCIMYACSSHGSSFADSISFPMMVPLLLLLFFLFHLATSIHFCFAIKHIWMSNLSRTLWDCFAVDGHFDHRWLFYLVSSSLKRFCISQFRWWHCFAVDGHLNLTVAWCIRGAHDHYATVPSV